MFAFRFLLSRRVVTQTRWHSSKFEGKPDISNEIKVKELISSLTDPERQMLYDRLRQVLIDEEISRTGTPVKAPNKLLAWFYGTAFSTRVKKYIKKPTSSQLGSLFAFHSLPYVAFGCLDNGIMIIGGEWIQSSIGTAIGLSTLASAALGNTLANSSSIALAYHVERYFTKKFFVKRTSSLSLDQFRMKTTKIVIQSARIVGIMLGCLIGMCPLLVIKH